jgi:hypothetical protein
MEDRVEAVDAPKEDEELDESGGKVAKIDEDLEEVDVEGTADFYDNLVPQLDSVELESLAGILLDAIRLDKEARKERDEQYAEAIKRTGLGKEAPGGATFEGASKAVDPMLSMAAFDFAARAIKELMPPNGPVKMFVPGTNVTAERMKKAERKKEFMNWQFKRQMPEFRTELEKLLTQVPMGGSMYLRLTPDYSKRKHRPVPRFLGIDEVSIPYAAANFYSAERQTYHEKITAIEFQARVDDGIYVVPEYVKTLVPSEANTTPVVAPTSTVPELSKAEKATEKVEGKKEPGSNKDGQRVVHECSLAYEFKKKPSNNEPAGRVPYIISIDETTRRIVAVVRNWEEEDADLERMQWMVEFPCLPWRGAYSVGFNQFIGSLSGAATGALRALIDASLIQNSQTLVKLKGANFTGQSERVDQTQIIELEGGVAGTQDIRELMMPLPFSGPSPTLFQLLGFLTERGQNAIHVAMEALAEGKTDMPVGTTLALIEEGMRLMAAIHLRLYHSMDYVINILHRINRMYLTDDAVENDIGEVLAYRSDFEGPLDCIPVADPEIFTDVQRIAQAQIVADRAAANPDLYNRLKAEKTLLERARIQNIDELLIQPPKPVPMNAVNENVAMTLGRPVAAFPEQDHLAHVQVLLDFLTSPTLGFLPIIAPSFIPAALEHLKQHVAYWYVTAFHDQLRQALGNQLGEDPMAVVMKERDPDTRAELDRTLATASQKIVRDAQKVFAQIPAAIQQAQQVLSQFKPPMQMPLDPNKADATQQKREAEQLRAQMKDKELAARGQEKIIDLQEQRQARAEDAQLKVAQLSADAQTTVMQEDRQDARQATETAARLKELARKEQSEDDRLVAKLESEERRNTQDNLTAVQISTAEIESGDKVDRSTGTGANPNPSASRDR